MLNELRDILLSIDDKTSVQNEGVFYGVCTKKDLGDWNYIVFNRRDAVKAGKTNAVSYSEYYEIHIIHEDYIPEGYVYEVIKEIEMQSGKAGCKLRQSDDKIEYSYTQKPNTEIVMEIATITFVHAIKEPECQNLSL